MLFEKAITKNSYVVIFKELRSRMKAQKVECSTNRAPEVVFSPNSWRGLIKYKVTSLERIS